MTTIDWSPRERALREEYQAPFARVFATLYGASGPD